MPHPEEEFSQIGDPGEPQPAVAAAPTELDDHIRAQFPTATFVVTQEDDPTRVYLTATVDIDDPDEVVDLGIDRQLTLQIGDGLPLSVVPVRTPERVAKQVAQAAQKRRAPIGQQPLPRWVHTMTPLTTA
jgi:hypothetical protein